MTGGAAARAVSTVALAAALAAAPAAADVRYESFPSASLGRDANYAVQLPPSYAAGGRRYPVLYVLHGLFEGPDFWEERGLPRILEDLWRSGDLPEMVVVAVDGDNSFFVDGSLGGYETLVTRDLVRHVEKTYRVTPRREGRALLGISMGGYAALRIALSKPDLYRVVASHSAVVLEAIPTAASGASSGHLAAFHRAFGDPIDAALWTAADPLSWAPKADPGRTPALYFDCGSEDRYGLFSGNEALHARLQARGVEHTFALRPGNHGYDYVRSVLAHSLRFIGAALRSGAQVPLKSETAPPGEAEGRRCGRGDGYCLGPITGPSPITK